jgi:integrase
VLQGGHPIAAELTDYLQDRAIELEASTIKTLRYRIGSIIEGRHHVPAEAFPWAQAWAKHIASTAVDTQTGVLAALRGFVAFMQKRGVIRGDVLQGIEVRGRKARGKPQARVDEARKLVVSALQAGDPPAIAVVVTLVFGLRIGEAVNLKCRDVDAGATLLWIDGTKNHAAKRAAEVPAHLRSRLQELVGSRGGDDLLFAFQPQRKRAAKDPHKARKDVVTRRLRQLCKDAGIPVLVPQSLRGMHSSFAREAGQTAHAVAQALGHTNLTTQRRHYLRPGVEAESDARSVAALLDCMVANTNDPSNRSESDDTEPSNENAGSAANTGDPAVRGGGIEPPWLLTASTSS